MKPSFLKSAPQKTWDSKKKSPVYLKGEAVQSRNHSSVTIKFKFIKKLKRLPFGNRLIDFVQIFFVGCYFWSSFKWAHFNQNLRGWVNIFNFSVQLSMEWPASKSIQGSIDVDSRLVFNKTLSQKSGSMGCGPGPAKISKTCLLCDVTSRNPPTDKRFFSILTTRLAESVDGLDSSLAQSPGEL